MRAVQRLVLSPGTPNSETLTADDLRLIIPAYRAGHEAAARILSDDLTDPQLHQDTSLVMRQELALAYLVHHGYRLFLHEVSKLVSTSMLEHTKELSNALFMAGIAGLERGLLKFDDRPITARSVHYLVTWFFAYARRELLHLEAPLGMEVTRYERLKKIAAVRSKLTEELGRKPTTEEVVEFFHSGKADRRSGYAAKRLAGTSSTANQRITAQMVEEQAALARMSKMDSLEDAQVVPAERRTPVSTPTVLTAFVEHYGEDLAPEPLSVLVHDMGYAGVSVQYLEDDEFKLWQNRWRRFFVSDDYVFGPFLESIPETSPYYRQAQRLLTVRRTRGSRQSKQATQRLFRRDLRDITPTH